MRCLHGSVSMPFVIVAWLTWFLCWSHWTDLFWLQNLLPMATWQSCACNCSTFCTYTYSGSPHNVMHLSSYCEPVLNLIKILWFRQQPHETLQVHFYCQSSNNTCNFHNIIFMWDPNVILYIHAWLSSHNVIQNSTHQISQLQLPANAHTTELAYYRNSNVKGTVNDSYSYTAHAQKHNIHTHIRVIFDWNQQH